MQMKILVCILLICLVDFLDCYIRTSASLPFQGNVYVIVYFWQHQVFAAAHRLSLVVVRRAALRCSAQASPVWLLSSGRTASRSAGFRSCSTEAQRLSCSMVCGIFLGHRLNRCPLHWQVDTYPLYHQGSPPVLLLIANATQTV